MVRDLTVHHTPLAFCAPEDHCNHWIAIERDKYDHEKGCAGMVSGSWDCAPFFAIVLLWSVMMLSSAGLN